MILIYSGTHTHYQFEIFVLQFNSLWHLVLLVNRLLSVNFVSQSIVPSQHVIQITHTDYKVPSLSYAHVC